MNIIKYIYEDKNNEKEFKSTIEALSKHKYPSIVPFIGFAVKNNFGYIYLAEVQNGSLHSFIKNNQFNPNFNNTAKYIISYGIAKSMQYLSNFYRMNLNLSTKNVLLDDKYYPFLTNFHSLPQKFDNIDSKFIAPEMIEEPNGSLVYSGIYSYGMILYELWTEIPAFVHIKSSNLIIEAAQNNKRPLIPNFLNENWKKLIEICWDPNPHSRPYFDDIVSMLETEKYYTDYMDKEKIDEYKKFFSNSDELYMPNFCSNEASENPQPKTEQKQQDEENHVLIKLREAAKTGDFASQFILAAGQFEGIFGHPNYEESLEYSMKYIKDCGEKDDYKSIMELYVGKVYVLFEDYENASKWLRLSVSHGCKESSFLLAELYVQDKAKCKRPNEIEYLYQIAADAGIPKAIKKYVNIMINSGLSEKFSIKYDKSRVSRYLKKSSEIGDPELMYLCAIRDLQGRKILDDKEKAMSLMKLSANLGYAPALVDYGIHLLNGINIKQNVEEAKYRFQAAAFKNNSYGQLWYYLMCKNNNCKDESLFNYLKLSLDSNNPESWSVYGSELVEKGEIDEALKCLYFGASNGSINALLCIGHLCEIDPKFGDSHLFFKLASNYCHCLDVCGFTSPVEYDIYHCDECDIDICEGCAKHCHLNHKTTKIGSKSGFKCQCGKNGFIGKCTGEFVGETCGYQHLYQCETCCNNDSEYICKSCAEKCHKDHKVFDCGVVRNFCSCGMMKMNKNFDCQLLKFDKNEKCCSQIEKRQRWFQCISCGLYGSDDIGVCEVCAHCCHDNHTILDLGVSDKSCQCNSLECLFTKE